MREREGRALVSVIGGMPSLLRHNNNFKSLLVLPDLGISVEHKFYLHLTPTTLILHHVSDPNEFPLVMFPLSNHGLVAFASSIVVVVAAHRETKISLA